MMMSISGNEAQKMPNAKYLNTSFLGYLTVPSAVAASACEKMEAIGVVFLWGDKVNANQVKSNAHILFSVNH